jgi:ribosomal protein L2
MMPCCKDTFTQPKNGENDMFVDKLLEFCDAVSLAAATAASTIIGNVIDLGTSPTGAILTNVQGYPGNSDVYLVIQMATAAAGANSTKVFELRSSTLVALTGGTTTTHLTTSAIAMATLAAGYQVFNGPIPRGTYQRYLGIWATNAGDSMTGGTVDAFLTLDPPTAWAPTADALTK